MSKHLFGLILTPIGAAANNRGESEGNLTTLQKLLWDGATHTTVSAEAIRGAIRYAWQRIGQRLNRQWDDEHRSHTWQDPDFTDAGRPYLDDDVLGFMSARAGREEADAAEVRTADRRSRVRGTVDARRARLEVTRALSIDPWPGDVVFNAAAPGATPAASRTGRDPVPYGAEVHATQYQYGFALTPEDLHERTRATLVLDAVASLSGVAGNHARFLYDFSPESLVLRWTDDPAPRILYSFRREADGEIHVRRLIELTRGGDIGASELWVGGGLAQTVDGTALADLGAHVDRSVQRTVEAVKRLAAP